ncbi:MAG: RNA polymerase sigma factor [Deltaproteobacteria bacterium]|nr:RNA polymerase sigma factor [Deltaproteobacteria bacterium]
MLMNIQGSRQTNSRADIQSLSDNDLMTLLQRGNMKALEELYVRYGNMVKSVIFRVVPNINAVDVDDLTQEIFIALLKSAGQFDGAKRFKPWLYGIAANKALDNRRTDCLHANLLGRHSESVQAAHKTHCENVDTKMDVRHQLESAFAVLPKEQHDVMILHAVEGFKGAEIAHILGIEINTVWVRLHRARKALSNALKDVTAG